MPSEVNSANKEELTPILLNLLQKIAESGIMGLGKRVQDHEETKGHLITDD